jgi:hypothetical protein
LPGADGREDLRTLQGIVKLGQLLADRNDKDGGDMVDILRMTRLLSSSWWKTIAKFWRL